MNDFVKSLRLVFVFVGAYAISFFFRYYPNFEVNWQVKLHSLWALPFIFLFAYLWQRSVSRRNQKKQ